MSANQRMIAEFHRVFGGEGTNTDDPALRPALHEEEHAELLEALASGDREHVAQELADVLYIAYGTAHVLGIDLDIAFAEVHRANMTKAPKCDGCNGLGYIPRVSGSSTLYCTRCGGTGRGEPYRRDDGKVLKAEGYRPPDLRHAVRQ